jgi:predicted nucleotidyltransferase
MIPMSSLVLNGFSSPMGQSFFKPESHYLFRYMIQQDIYQQIKTKKSEILRLAETYGASHVQIFGSVARHTADEKSDIDFLVEMEPGKTLFDLGGLAYDLEKLLGRRVDVCTIPLLREPIRSRVVSEAVPL